MRPLLDSRIADVLAGGGRVLAASMRAARALRRAYAEDAQARGEQSWPAPRISDWSSWIASLYTALSLELDEDLPQPLSALQEDHLWRRVQREDAARVVSPARLAGLASEAYALLGSYDAHESRRAPWAAEAGEDAEHFLQWADSFERECTRLNVVSRSQLESLVRTHVETLIAAQCIEAQLLLVGFDRLTPARSRLLEQLATGGVTWELSAATTPSSAAELLSASTGLLEIDACAAWIHEHLMEEPGMRIGVLAPQLSSFRADVERSFRRSLRMAEEPGGEQQAPLYEFSLGDPLAVMPNVAAALLLLQWLAQPLAGAEVSSLLVSGFLAANAAEAALLAQTDVVLRRHGLLRTEISLRSLLHDSARMEGLLPPSVHERLQQAQQWAARDGLGRRTYAEWADQVPQLLALFGWPGSADRSSIPFQAEQRWAALVEETASLNLAGERISWATYIADLRSAAFSTLFAAESSDAPVQIVGISEASGQSFDALWVLGMTEDNWPPRGRPHPLLPPWLQREHGMPHASPHIDLALAEEQLRRVQASAPTLVWSYALQSGGVEQRPSPMLSLVTGDMQARPLAEAADAPAPATVCVADTGAPMPWPLERTAGGSEVLKRQSACGFQGFARGRLHVSPLEPESWGLSPAERGTILHRALEHLWSTTPVEPGSGRLHSQADLLQAMDDGSIDSFLHASVTAALHPMLRRASSRSDHDRWMENVLALEAERLTARLLLWLDQEEARAPFRVVATERDVKDASIGELRLHLRLDRADELADNRLLLVDYKTADRVSVKQWQGERPEEPQLPIYALYGNLTETLGAVGGVAFAQIRAGDGKTAMMGLAEDPAAQLGPAFGTPEGKPPKHVLTDQMRGEWGGALQALAASFVRGEAQVQPRDGARTCQTCNLFVLCRIRSQSNSGALLVAGAEGEESADA